jgi:hypothetical protein
MGRSSYSLDTRDLRAANSGFYSKERDEIFTQQKKKKIHASMDPRNVLKRESCDSEAHPDTVPIQLYLDVTGSMGRIPHEMIKDGLPTLMGSLIQKGVKDAALMFGAIGDHECDRHPLQIAQFESGDEELDMWLTRTYIEEGGGGNAGESYLLAWYFAANHVKTDAWDKRKKKGFVFTIGDEPCLRDLPMSALKEIMGDTTTGQGKYTAAELLAAAEVQNHIFHINITHSYRGMHHSWKELLGDHLIEITDHRDVSKVIAEKILQYSSNLSPAADTITKEEPKKDNSTPEKPSNNTEIIL